MVGKRVKSSFNMCSCIPDRVGIFLTRGKPENLEKNLSEKGENQQQTQPTYDAGTGNRAWATLVGGECCHHCTTPVPQGVVQFNKMLSQFKINRAVFN